jgi:FixJ family two-component response regulator
MERPRVAVIDDDESVRESLPDLLREFGYRAEVYSSAEAFLSAGRPGDYLCLVLDLSMPGMSGIELQQEIARRNIRVPIVFITAHGDEDLRQRLRADGIECILKPFTDTVLLDAIQKVLSAR